MMHLMRQLRRRHILLSNIKVLRRVSNQLGASRIFTRVHIDELAPVDEQMSEKEKKAMTEGAKIELEHESQVSTPMEVDIDAPRKRQAEERQSGATPSKQRAVTFDVPPTSSASLGSTVKSSAVRVKSKPTPPDLPTPNPPDLPKPNPPELPKPAPPGVAKWIFACNSSSTKRWERFSSTTKGGLWYRQVCVF